MLILVIVCIAIVCWFWVLPLAIKTRTMKTGVHNSAFHHIYGTKIVVDEDRITLVNEAIASGLDLHFQYKKADGTITRRTVTPRELRRLTSPEIQRLVGSDIKVTWQTMRVPLLPSTKAQIACLQSTTFTIFRLSNPL